jgi:hypothetical protein
MIKLPPLYIAQFSDDEDEDIIDAYMADIDVIHDHVIGTGKTIFSTTKDDSIPISKDELSEIILENGILYWCVKNTQYIALDLKYDYEPYDDKIRIKVVKFIRDNKITQLGI